MEYDLSAQAKLIKNSKQVHSKWYLEMYPDVAKLGMDPARHYIKYGAALGRNPGKNFDTNFYLSTYPEVGEQGINPLLHYVLYGQAKGYERKPKKPSTKKMIGEANSKLLNFGFTEQPLSELEAIAREDEDVECRLLASQRIAVWHMRSKEPDGFIRALEWVEVCRENSSSMTARRDLAVLELIALFNLGKEREAEEAAERALNAGELSPNFRLAYSNIKAGLRDKLLQINYALKAYDIPQVSLSSNSDLPLYDRLECKQCASSSEEGPKVSVLVAAYEAGQTLETALRSLECQTWRNLEVLILDDCSPSEATREIAMEFERKDERFRYIRMAENGGAYAARNYGLLVATGELVTLHDSDDWSHPKKIETQARFLMDSPQFIGCTSEQARCTDELIFNVFRRVGSLIIPNISSFMFRRHEVLDAVGGWDGVRFGADVQFISRIKKYFGPDCCADIETGPLSFQRSNEGSATGHAAFGFDGFKFGVRRVYEHLSDRWLEQQEVGKIAPGNSKRLFPAPAPMRKDRPSGVRHFDVILASDFRFPGGTTSSNAEEIKAQSEMGFSTGLVELFYYNMNSKRPINEKIISLVDEGKADFVCYGETVECENLIIRQPMAFDSVQRYIPNVKAKNIQVIINQPPMRDYSAEGERVFDLRRCADAIEKMFGTGAIWHPIGPLVRNALVEHHADELNAIKLSESDWPNIIEPSEWRRVSDPDFSKRPIRICRHSRDSYAKWPSSADVISYAYPESDEFEINVLGGATAPQAVLGGSLPANWKVQEFGSVPPREFLSEQDVFVYFTHPDWVEAFGRVIFEPMAVGIPVILPRGIGYEDLFGAAALYADASEVSDIVKELYGDPDKYLAQVERANNIIREKFSYATHFKRLSKEGRSTHLAAVAE